VSLLILHEPGNREALADILGDIQAPLVEKPTEEWLTTLVAWMVDEQPDDARAIYVSNDATFADALQLTCDVGARLEAELAGRFKKIVPVEGAVIPFTSLDGELSACVVDNVKLTIMSEDPREITCALAAEMLKADPSHDTLFIRQLIRKYTVSAGFSRYDTRFATAKTA